MSVFFTGLKRSAKIIEEKWEMRHEKLQPYKQVEIQEHIHKRNLCTLIVNWKSFFQVALRGLPLLMAAAALGCFFGFAATDLPWGL